MNRILLLLKQTLLNRPIKLKSTIMIRLPLVSSLSSIFLALDLPMLSSILSFPFSYLKVCIHLSFFVQTFSLVLLALETFFSMINPFNVFRNASVKTSSFASCFEVLYPLGRTSRLIVLGVPYSRSTTNESLPLWTSFNHHPTISNHPSNHPLTGRFTT